MREYKRHEVTESEIQAFNWTRESMVGKEMNLEGLREQLKKLQYKPNGNFIAAIISGENPPIIRVNRGKYVFNPKPVYIDRLKTVWNNYTDRCNSNRKNNTPVAKISIEDAIAVLKQHGYRVLKPKVEYEEI